MRCFFSPLHCHRMGVSVGFRLFWVLHDHCTSKIPCSTILQPYRCLQFYHIGWIFFKLSCLCDGISMLCVAIVVIPPTSWSLIGFPEWDPHQNSLLFLSDLIPIWTVITDRSPNPRGDHCWGPLLLGGHSGAWSQKRKGKWKSTNFFWSFVARKINELNWWCSIATPRYPKVSKLFADWSSVKKNPPTLDTVSFVAGK